MNNKENIILSISDVSKTYKTTIALSNVSVEFEKGKVTSIYGPNGAGKSTLIKIIVGEEKADNGQIYINGDLVGFNNYYDALKNGISYVPQDFGLLNNLSVIENIGILYNQFTSKIIYSENNLIEFIQKNKANDLFFPDYDTIVKDLTTFEKQILATQKALLINSEIIIFDESTTNLNTQDFLRFKNIINTLKDKGKAIIFISHKIDEVFDISDNLIVLKEGTVIKKGKISDFDKTKIIKQYNIKLADKKFDDKFSDVLTSIKLNDYNEEIILKKGEIIAIDSDDTRIKQNIGYRLFEKIRQKSNLKVGIIPSSRDEEAIFPNMSVQDNLLINVYDKKVYKNSDFANNTLLHIANDLKLVYRDWEQNINELSGGNKQKVVFGRWILDDFNLLILIEPTSGIDIETKNILHNKILELKNKGKSFILITSDEGEQNILSDKIISLNLENIYDTVS